MSPIKLILTGVLVFVGGVWGSALLGWVMDSFAFGAAAFVTAIASIAGGVSLILYGLERAAAEAKEKARRAGS